MYLKWQILLWSLHCKCINVGLLWKDGLLKSALACNFFDLDSCVNLADNYQTTFHPVAPGVVLYPSHTKRFEIKMFTFVQNDVMIQDQVIISSLRSDCVHLAVPLILLLSLDLCALWCCALWCWSEWSYLQETVSISHSFKNWNERYAPVL